MGTRFRTGLVCAAMALGISTSVASANGRNPGSLLIYPEYDNVDSRITLISVTNTNSDLVSGSVYVEVVWLNGEGTGASQCAETNQTYRLSPNDTLTLLSSNANPNMNRGFAYAFAKDVQGRAISFDWLIGDTLLIDPIFSLDYAIAPLVFTSPRPLNQPTDLDGDGNRDLDGLEYEAAPDKILVPRFLGQGPLATSELVLINLTGGSQFTAIANFLVYNDNEEVFSRNYQFRCWTKVPLTTISSQFNQSFLATSTNNDPSEIVGYPMQESGWFEIDGSIAFSTAVQFPDPAILAVLVETAGSLSGAETAFTIGTQTNGALFPNGILGDVD